LKKKKRKGAFKSKEKGKSTIRKRGLVGGEERGGRSSNPSQKKCNSISNSGIRIVAPGTRENHEGASKKKKVETGGWNVIQGRVAPGSWGEKRGGRERKTEPQE